MRRQTILGVRRNRLFSTLMSDHYSTVNEGQAFSLKSGEEFASRSKQVFDGLGTLEHQHETRQSEFSKDNFEKSDPVTEDILDTTVSNFKTPVGFAPRKRKRINKCIPEYVKHPMKWQKYSLADVPEHTEEANTMAAMRFLKFRKKETASCTNVDKTPVFRRPVISDKRPTGSDDSKCHYMSSGSVAVMPECVVGKKVKAARKLAKAKMKALVKKDKITLPHLSDGLNDEV